MSTIFDYSEALQEVRRFFSGANTRESVLFDRKRGWCLFCNDAAEKTSLQSCDGMLDSATTAHEDLDLWQCQKCGWWELLYEYAECDNVADGSEFLLTCAILKQFSVDDIQLPVQALRSEVHKRPDLVYQIHPTKLEELVGSVFSDFFECEVQHCGRSHDGGIDLFFVLSDVPSIVQVKRRQHPRRTEAVSSVREFLGVMVLSAIPYGYFVTTADHFSAAAIATAELAKVRRVVRRFELIDLRKLLGMLGVAQLKAPSDAWRRYLPEFRLERVKGMYVRYRECFNPSTWEERSLSRLVRNHENL